MVSQPDLAQLQALILNAVLGQASLPGASHPPRLADLGMLTAQDTIPVSDRNLAAKPALTGAGKALRLVSPGRPGQGRLVYLEFGPAQSEGDVVTLALGLKIDDGSGQAANLGLSSLVFRFRRTAQGWRAEGDPAALAN